MYALVGALTLFLILVTFHEYGHYSVARYFKIKIIKFSIGCGPDLNKWKKNDHVKFSLSAIPFGGYVAFHDPADTENYNKLNTEEKKYVLANRPALERSLVVLAGPIYNFILAFFVFTLVGLFIPKQSDMVSAQVAEIDNQKFYEVVAVNNKEINSADDFNGLKFRMPGIGGQALALTGASVQVLPGGEIYQALASGAIDGAEWIGPFADEKMGFQEVCKFYYTAGYHEPGSALCSAFNLDVYESFTPTQKKIVEIAAQATSLNNYSLGLANNGAALKRIVAQGVKIMEFPDNVWDLFGESAVNAMDKYMDDSLYAQIRESYETSLRGTTSWLDRADRTYVKQRARVFNL